MKKGRRRITSAPVSVNNLYFQLYLKDPSLSQNDSRMEPLNSLVKESA